MWKEALVRGLQRQGMTVKHKRPNVNTWHNAKLPYTLEQVGQLVPSDPSILQYTLVRHPITRLLSAYLDKVAHRNPADRKKYASGYNHKTGFDGFIKWVTAHASDDLKLNPHFRLQSEGCGIPDGVQYRVLRTEEIGRWYREVVCRLGLVEAVSDGFPDCFLKTRDCGCTVTCGGPSCNESHFGTYAGVTEFTSYHFRNATEQIEEYYTHETAQLVNVWASADLAAFRYKPWLPGQDIIVLPFIAGLNIVGKDTKKPTVKDAEIVAAPSLIDTLIAAGMSQSQAVAMAATASAVKKAESSAADAEEKRSSYEAEVGLVALEEQSRALIAKIQSLKDAQPELYKKARVANGTGATANASDEGSNT
jgi:hypothetical protein